MNVAVFFSGGVDSMLAIQLAATGGHQIKCLAAFNAPQSRLFETLDMQFIDLASVCLGIPVQKFELEAGDRELPDLAESLQILKKEHNINAIVTGAGTESLQTRCLEEIGRSLELTCIYPLIGIKQKNVLYAALKNKYKVLMVKTNGYKELLGKVLDEQTIHSREDPLLLDSAVQYGKGSMILDSPLFSKKISVTHSKTIREGTIMRLLVTGIVLENK